MTMMLGVGVRFEKITRGLSQNEEKTISDSR